VNLIRSERTAGGLTWVNGKLTECCKARRNEPEAMAKPGVSRPHASIQLKAQQLVTLYAAIERAGKFGAKRSFNKIAAMMGQPFSTVGMFTPMPGENQIRQFNKATGLWNLQDIPEGSKPIWNPATQSYQLMQFPGGGSAMATPEIPQGGGATADQPEVTLMQKLLDKLGEVSTNTSDLNKNLSAVLQTA
jgi:hypothetical protein